jgi:hypothetical protein
MDARLNLLSRLDNTIARLFTVYGGIEHPEMVVIGEWTAKDILGHIVFWHESFARNVYDIASNVKPTPLKGRLTDLNQQSVVEMQLYSTETLLLRLESAHLVIRQNIRNPGLELIPYRQGSRPYTPEEHLEIVDRHLSGHLNDIEKALSASG